MKFYWEWGEKYLLGISSNFSLVEIKKIFLVLQNNNFLIKKKYLIQEKSYKKIFLVQVWGKNIFPTPLPNYLKQE